MFNPFRWFSRAGRTEMAVKLYNKEVFQGATFADMQRAGGPLVVINASDLGYGGRFAFVQEYFDLGAHKSLNYEWWARRDPSESTR